MDENFTEVDKLIFDFASEQWNKSVNKNICKNNEIVCTISFEDLKKFNSILSEEFLSNAYDFITKLSHTIKSNLQVDDLIIEFSDVPNNYLLKEDNLSVKKLDKFVYSIGKIMSCGKIQPVIVAKRYECPSCGGQIYKKFSEKENIYCSCGRKNDFIEIFVEYGEEVVLKIFLSESNSEPIEVHFRAASISSHTKKMLEKGNTIQVCGYLRLFEKLRNYDYKFSYFIDAFSISLLTEAPEEQKGFDIDKYFESISPKEFETLIGYLFEHKGYSVKILSYVGDKGLDVIAQNNFEIIGIQCKKYSPDIHIGAPDIQKAIGGAIHYHVNKLIFVTTAERFTNAAFLQIRDIEIKTEFWDRQRTIIELQKHLGKELASKGVNFNTLRPSFLSKFDVYKSICKELSDNYTKRINYEDILNSLKTTGMADYVAIDLIEKYGHDAFVSTCEGSKTLINFDKKKSFDSNFKLVSTTSSDFKIINEILTTSGNTILIEEVISKAKDKNISPERVKDIIEKLKRGGDLFSPKPGYVSRI